MQGNFLCNYTLPGSLVSQFQVFGVIFNNKASADTVHIV